MTTTADKLNRLLEIKANIKQAIRDKGVYIGDYDAFAEYPDAIRSIEVGGGEEITGSYIIAKFPDDMEEGDNLLIRAIELDMSSFNTSNVENMNDMFHDYFNLRELNLSNFNTENVKEMTSMFNGCANLMLLDLSNWNTGNVTTMENMFNRCANLAELDLSSFNTSNVENMNYMFNECMNLEVLDIRNFDTSNVREMYEMFNGCENLHTLRLDNCNRNTIEKIISLAYFPTGDIDGETRKMYVQEANVAGLTAPEGWIFVDSDGNEIVPEPEEEPEIYVPGYYQGNTEITEATTMVNSSHTNLSEMFSGCTNLQTINNIEQWDTSNVTNMWRMFYQCNNLTSLDLSSFNTSNVTDMSDMFQGCYNLTTLDLSNFDMSKVENTDSMFYYCDNLQELRLDNCSAETVEKIINSEGLPTGEVAWEKRKMYVNSKAAEVLKPIDGWVFIDCETLKEIEVKEPASPYEEGQFSNNTDMTVANTLVTAEHKNLSNMFGGCTNLAVVNTSDWDTSNVTGMDDMFSNCENLPYLDLSSFKTSNVENMNNMFAGCTDLLYLDISNFTVGESCVVDKNFESGMFWDCTSLLDLRLDNCDKDTINRIINSRGFQVNPNNKIEDLPRVVYVRKENEYHLELSDGSVFGYIEDPVYIKNKDDVTKTMYINDKEVVNVMVNTQIDYDRYEDNNSLERLFENCGNLRLINGIEQWNTTGIENMSYMFAGCTHLVSLNLSSFDISNAHNIEHMFEGCTNLRYLDISNFIMGEESFLYNTTDMFRDCNNLRHLRLDNCDRNTIEKIIHGSDLPMYDIDGEKRKMYVQEANAVNEWGDKLEAPDGWIFVFVDSDGNEIVPEPEIPVCEFCGEEGCDGSCQESGEEEPAIYQVGYYQGNTEITEATTMVNDTHTDLSNMFNECTNLTTINNIDQWDTSNVYNMIMMFYKCNNLASIDLSSFNTSNVTKMGSMFTYCYKLTELDLSNFNTSKVTEMDYIFKQCTNLTTINGIDQWNTHNVTDMMSMFEGCSSLTSLDLSNWYTIKVTNIASMFWKCSNLEVLDIRNFDMGKIANIFHSDPTYRGNAGMLMECANLRELRLDNCSKATIRNIITSYGFPTNAIEGVTRKIYCREANTTGLTAPTNWVFEFVG